MRAMTPCLQRACLPWLMVSIAILAAPTPARAEENILEQVVVLSRHGVRSPTKQTALMNAVTPNPWPKWPVPAGYLTPRGEQLVGLMGTFYGDYLRAKGLLPTNECPADGVVRVWADIDQRTLLTGEALLAGMAPQCGLKIYHQADLHKTDPLFHPVEAGVCRLDARQTKDAVAQQLGAPLDTVSTRYADSFSALAHVLDFPASPLCAKQTAEGKSCDFATVQSNDIKVGKHGEKVSLSGPLALSSTLTEIFLLEYAQNMPEVAWGRLGDNPDEWATLMRLHNVQFDLMAKTPYIARHKATPLLQAISGALTHPRDKQTSAAGLRIPAQNRVFFLAGHDTNIANVAGMLGLNWSLPGQPDNTPPGGGLMFELWRNPIDQQQYVSIKMFYQSRVQLRNMTPLELNKNPAGVVPLSIPDCDNQGDEKLCRLDLFQKKVALALTPACTL